MAGLAGHRQQLGGYCHSATQHCQQLAGHLEDDIQERHCYSMAVELDASSGEHLQTGSDGTGKAKSSFNVKRIKLSQCIILPGYPIHEIHGHGISNYQALIRGNQLHTSGIVNCKLSS